MTDRLRSIIGVQGRYLGVLLFATLLGLLIQACSNSDQAKLSVGDQAPAFTLPTATGGTVSLSDYQDRQPTLLYFHMAKG